MGGGPWHLCGGRVGSAAATARVRGGHPRVGRMAPPLAARCLRAAAPAACSGPSIRLRCAAPPAGGRAAPAAGSTMPEGSGAGRVLGPEHPLAVRAAARLVLEQRRALTAYGIAGDPWAFIRDCVWTRDEATGQVRRYPNQDYAELLVRRWRTEPLLAVAKSRRMVVTWLFVACNYWLARFSPLAKVAFMARKLGKTETEGSAELVRRAHFIHRHLPPTLPPCEVEYSVGFLRFPNGSEIVALG